RTGVEPVPLPIFGDPPLREPRGGGVVIVTGRQPTCHAASVAWLRKHGLGHLEIIYVDKYGRPPPDNGSRGRSPTTPPMLSVEAFNTLHFDVAIDDSPDALDLLAPRTDCRIIIFDRPWNRAYPPTPSMSRARSWADVLEQICRPKTSGT
ncbi:MAG: hypothetical protein FWH21_09415, partial [Kiritimatiellaeota bacterium]|nr:hypothetical protein [Kiritimatiellota bacterium]